MRASSTSTSPTSLHQLTTFEVEAASRAEQAEVLARFGSFFAGKLWDVYARRVLDYGPI